MTYNTFKNLVNEVATPEALGELFGRTLPENETFLRNYCKEKEIRGWKGGKIENLEAKVCNMLFSTKKKEIITEKEEPTMTTETNTTIESTEETTEAVAETTESATEETTEKVKAEKKARKTTRKTVDTMIAEVKAAIPNADLVFEENSKGTAIHVKLGKTRIFGYSGPILVVAENLTTGVEFEKKDYGCRVLPTAENMKKVYENLVAASEKKAEKKAKEAAEKAEKKATAEKARAEKKAAKEAEKKTAETPAETTEETTEAIAE